jgi:hypothetical protein
MNTVQEFRAMHKHVDESMKSRESLTLWINELLDPSGLLYACVICYNEYQARNCHASYEEVLTEEQRKAGWIARLRSINSWDELPVCAQSLS